MKKIISIGITICISISLVSCSSKKKGSEDFENWSATLPLFLMGNEDYGIYSLFDHPENIGIEMEVDGLTFTTKEEYEENVENSKEIRKQLRSFDYDTLNEDQKITYDLLEDTLNNMIDSEDYYYVSTNYFDVNSGVQSSLALNLCFTNLKSKEVIEAIIKVMESTTNMFVVYSDFEKERQEKNLGMSKTYMEEVLEQIKTFNGMDHSYLLEGLQNKIEEASFLEENEKEKYKMQIEKAYNEHFLPAFKKLETDLASIEIKTQDEDASLADYENGKEYYKQLIYEYTGFTSVEAFNAFLDSEEDKITDRLYALLKEYPELYDMLNEESDAFDHPTYISLTSAQEVLAYLEKTVQECGDFPVIDDIDYTMDVIPEALQEIYKASAAYYISPFDNMDSKEQMILNGEFEQSDYSTVAHEGFPGHLYQFTYFKTTDHNILRDLLANSGYSEGWAVYASKEMMEYSEDSAICKYLSLNEDLIYICLMRMDVMIHYENASREEAYAYLNENFSGLEQDGLKETYEQILLDPAIFVPYYGYYLRLLNLKEAMQEEWGFSYNDYKFNKKVLDLGALPFSLLEMYMEE